MKHRNTHPASEVFPMDRVCIMKGSRIVAIGLVWSCNEDEVEVNTDGAYPMRFTKVDGRWVDTSYCEFTLAELH